MKNLDSFKKVLQEWFDDELQAEKCNYIKSVED